MAMESLLIIVGVLVVLLIFGVPISYSIGISSLVAILQTVPLDISVVTGAQRIFVGMSKFSLTAIPFFILAGNLMNQGGIAKRLVDFVMALLGKLPGALLVTNVGANALFGAISGSASAAAAAVGSMVEQGEKEQGYDPALCAATNGASAPAGLLIPPSNALITYSARCRRHFGGGPVPCRLYPRHPLGARLHPRGCFSLRKRRDTGASRANLTGKTSGSAPCAPCRPCP